MRGHPLLDLAVHLRAHARAGQEEPLHAAPDALWRAQVGVPRALPRVSALVPHAGSQGPNARIRCAHRGHAGAFVCIECPLNRQRGLPGPSVARKHPIRRHSLLPLVTSRFLARATHSTAQGCAWPPPRRARPATGSRTWSSRPMWRRSTCGCCCRRTTSWLLEIARGRRRKGFGVDRVGEGGRSVRRPPRIAQTALAHVCARVDFVRSRLGQQVERGVCAAGCRV